MILDVDFHSVLVNVLKNELLDSICYYVDKINETDQSDDNHLHIREWPSGRTGRVTPRDYRCIEEKRRKSD